MTRSFSFPRKQRLQRRRDFRRVFARRHRLADRHLVIYVAYNGLQYSRLGLSVGRRVGKAVVRNRFKRRVREAFRLEQIAEHTPGVDLICLCPGRRVYELEDYRRSFRRLMEKVKTE